MVELPTPDETFDNIVAFWNPVDKPSAGQELLFGYRLYWGSKMPVSPPLAQVVATRTGIGGIVGQKRKYFSWRFVVDFAGGDLGMIGKNVKVEPVITASRGQIEITSARPLDSIQGYRAMFDLKLGRLQPRTRGPAPLPARRRPAIDGNLALPVDSAGAAPVTARRPPSPVNVMLLDREASESELPCSPHPTSPSFGISPCRISSFFSYQKHGVQPP